MENEQRLFYLTSEISPDGIKDISQAIYELNQYDDLLEEELKNYNRPEITLMINNYGGCAYSGFALSSQLMTSKTPVKTVCIGQASSSALMVFMSGHYRVIYPYSSLMYHSASWGLQGNIGQHESNLDQSRFIQKQYDEIILDNLFIYDEDKEEEIINTVKEKLNYYVEVSKDWWIDYIEAFNLGFAHEIAGMSFENILDVEEQVANDEDIIPVSELEGEIN